MTDYELLAATTNSLKRIQEFDVTQLVQKERLGSSLEFGDVLPWAQRLVDLFKRLSSSALEDFPDEKLQAVSGQADQVYNLFEQILNFNTAQSSPSSARDHLINSVKSQHPVCFDTLHPLISYSLHRSADFQHLDQVARATLQQIKDDAERMVSDLKKAQDAGKEALDGIKAAAAESGVTQQAVHFADEAKKHETASEAWQNRTLVISIILLTVAVAALPLHKWSWLSPATTAESIQLALGKLLVFATISYTLYLAARNFLSHKHNAIVNKHRQNALLTYKALAEAAHTEPNRDVVLTYAAACIFGPQATGYAKDGGEALAAPNSVVGLVREHAALSE